MPKIRDLGINVIPETMRPPEIGPGGGGGGGGCPVTSPITTGYWDAGQTCLTTSPGHTGYYQQAHTAQTCLTTSPGQTGGTGYYQAQAQVFTGQTCLTTSPGQPGSAGCYQAQVAGYTCLTTSPIHRSQFPDCALSREAIQQLKAQLQQQIEYLEEYARNLGPKTVEAIEAREKELKAELEELAQRRKEYKKNE